MLYEDYDDVKADLKNIAKVILKHQDYIENAKNILNIKVQKDKTVVYEESAKLPSYIFYFDELKNHIKKIKNLVSYRLDEVYGRLYRLYKTNYDIQLTEGGIDKYIKNEKEYSSMRYLYLEIEELYDNYVSIAEALSRRGYCLNNMTKILTFNDTYADND